jgi:galactose mutarotase-like enzyme
MSSMTQSLITHGSIEGFANVQVDTGPLHLSLVPELGGKINSLRDLRTGREWLWRNPRMPYRRATAESAYVVMADTGGWDECFPTVAPSRYPSPPWAGRAIPDHGELWAQTAALQVGEGAGQVNLQTSWPGVVLPYRFERSVLLTAGSANVRAEYRVTNQGDAPLHFIWSIHPLLAIEPGMQLHLPPEARYYRWSSVPNEAVAESGLSFPLTLAGHDLAALPEPSAGVALKLWSEPLAAGQGWATLRARDGELRLRWDPALLPQVGFWMNLGGWAGDGGAPYYNLGLEPCIGAQDSLADAVTRHNLFAALGPGQARAWWLEVELGQ